MSLLILLRMGVIHRDVKPDNILVNSRGEVKITDFNGSREAVWDDQEPTPYSPRVGTPSYKAPEMILQTSYYDFSVDLWSIGCVMAELWLNDNLFDVSLHLETSINMVDRKFNGRILTRVGR